jgi:hypothetical protein
MIRKASMRLRCESSLRARRCRSASLANRCSDWYFASSSFSTGSSTRGARTLLTRRDLRHAVQGHDPMLKAAPRATLEVRLARFLVEVG